MIFRIRTALCLATLIFSSLTFDGFCKDTAKEHANGNPIFEGWYADPEGVVFGDRYWIYPTRSAPFREQTSLDAFSSADLVHWKKHARIIDKTSVKWLTHALWAPSIIQKSDRYFLFFSGNNIQRADQPGGIGVAVADQPAGPFADHLGKPLISGFHNGAQPIDQFVFKDGDSKYYIYFGGWGHCNVAILNEKFDGLLPFDDGKFFKEVTPKGYVEGPFMLEREGKYYFMWSEGNWTGPSYRVAYAISDSPTGPFERLGTILQQDPRIATGAGHHSVINIPGTDEWYIVYHRRPLSGTDSNHRVTCIDKMEFDASGKIKPVRITHEGVPAREIPDPVGAYRLDGRRLPALKESGIDLKSTKEEDLKRADEGRVVPLILRHREATKRAQQADTFLKAIGPDCRIHGRFEPTGTDTGRFSSRNPNLQNIGRGELREAFVPEDGHKFVVADYSQVELRAAAAIAGEEKMIAAYKEGIDLHRLTASLLLDIDLADVGKEQRQLAKSANFGNLYGQGAKGLSRYAANSFGVELDVEEAGKIRERFFDTYGKLRRWHGGCWEAARQQVELVRTRLGRRRLIPPTASDWQRFTALVNTPVQGGTADGMKYAIVLLSEKLPAEARIIATVHDEVVVECPETDVENVRALMVDTMREAMGELFPEVPIEVEASIGSSWADK